MNSIALPQYVRSKYLVSRLRNSRTSLLLVGLTQAVEKLGKKHAEHIKAYGEGNERRLTGAHETAPIDKFGWGVANRGCSIRVPRSVPIDKCGYYEDRRPASNMDPYIVTGKIVDTTVLG